MIVIYAIDIQVSVGKHVLWSLHMLSFPIKYVELNNNNNIKNMLHSFSKVSFIKVHNCSTVYRVVKAYINLCVSKLVTHPKRSWKYKNDDHLKNLFHYFSIFYLFDILVHCSLNVKNILYFTLWKIPLFLFFIHFNG